jgi:hypothetical protein
VEEAGLYMTLIKVKSDFQNNILVNHKVRVPIYFFWCHIDPAVCDHNILAEVTGVAVCLVFALELLSQRS